MTLRRVVTASVLASFLLGSIGGGPRLARADDKTTCIDAHGQSQVLRREGRVKAARAQLAICAAPSCPPLVAKDCTTWLGEVVQPTIILSVRDDAGRDVLDAQVSLDGAPLTGKLDGRPIDVDPGNHVVRTQLPDGSATETTIVVAATERDRLIRIDAKPAGAQPQPPHGQPPRGNGNGSGALSETPPPVSSETHPPRVAPWVLGGVGVVALGSFGYFALTGRAHENRLADNCAPNCEESERSSVRRSYLVADISLGVGVVALGIATWLALAPRR